MKHDYEVRTRLAAREIEDGLQVRTEIRTAFVQEHDIKVWRGASGEVALTFGYWRADLTPREATRLAQLLLAAAAGEPADG